MNEKEFRKLSRLELVDLIYQLEKDLEAEKVENASLRDQLAQKDAELQNTLSITESVNRLNQVCESAEKIQEEYWKRKKAFLKKKRSILEQMGKS